MSAWGKLYASELFDNVRFPEGKLYEDVGTTYRLILQCPQVIFLPVALYDYLQTPSSIIHRPFEFSKLDLISQTDQMCEDIETTLASRDLPRHLRDALRCRRMHARFSILRQMVLFDDFNELSPENRQKFIDTQSEIINYLKTHKNDVLKNPAATSRDRLAMRSLGFGLPAFKMAWKIYSRQ